LALKVDLAGRRAFCPLANQDSSNWRCMTSSPQNITQLLVEWGNGDKEALDKLLPIVYEELRRQAERFLRRERPNHTLQPTALIHEAYLKLINQEHMRWQNRAQFFGIAAQLMRRILVDHARGKQAAKRGGEDVKLQLDEAMIGGRQKDVNLVTLDEALNRLGQLDEQQGKIVELRYFSGLSIDETSAAVSISPATVKRDWTIAKAWLRREILSDE
jgi:RNA polymerase sigma-70 factor (ECF subfamily)